jgi:hypothetical protein
MEHTKIENGWLISDQLGFNPERVVRSFVLDSEQHSPSTHHIIKHFHSSITDYDIRRIKTFFHNCSIPICIHTYGNELHYELETDLHYSSGRRKKKVLFGIEKDPFFNNFRIVGVRYIDRKWKIRRTVYSTNNTIVSWKATKENFLVG